MLSLRRLELKNFKSFAGSHVVDFTAYQPGLHFIRGVNEVHAKIGSNGAGKSTLFDSVLWALYGKTTRGLRASNVRSWSAAEGCAASLELATARGDIVTVARSWQPNTLTVAAPDAKPVEQPVIDSIVGLSEDLFRQSVLIGQASSTFMDLPPAQKLVVFSQLLDLEVWTAYSDRAKEAAAAHEKDCMALQAKFDAVSVAIEEQIENIKELKRRFESFEDELDARIADLEQRCKAAQADLEKGVPLLKEAEAVYKDLLSESAKIQENLARHRSDLLTASAEESEARANLKRANESIAEINNAICAAQELKGTCRLCGQRIDPKNLVHHVEELEHQLADARRASERWQVRMRKKGVVVKEIEALEDGTHRRLSEWGAQANDVRGSIESLRARHTRLTDAIVAYRNDIKDEKERANPYEELLSVARTKLKKAKSGLVELEDALTNAEQDVEAAKFWIAAFKRIRLELISAALQDLELETNSALSELGLNGWTMSFSIERETQSKSISRGFHVFVEGPATDGPVPWEAWSGGESQRLRLAAIMGLMGTVAARSGAAADFEIWDEPTAYLSVEGVQDLIQLLAARAQRLQRRIFLIDHRSLDAGDFATVTTIRRDAEGSHIDGPGAVEALAVRPVQPRKRRGAPVDGKA